VGRDFSCAQDASECIAGPVAVMSPCSILVKFNSIFLKLQKCAIVRYIRVLFLVIVVSTKKNVQQLCYEIGHTVEIQCGHYVNVL
jgi:hypothetical protein